MANYKDLTLDRVKSLLRYDAETGIFYWITRRSGARADGIAGTPMSAGYLSIGIDRHRILAHRLAWFVHYGRWPEGVIDHIDKDRTNNRIANLREATRSQNAFYAPKPKNNTSGFKGVVRNRSARKNARWIAQITINQKTVYLGSFDTPEEAHAAYAEKSKMMNGEFHHD